MTEPALKLKVFVGFPSYGGNGGISSEHPHIREWWTETILKMRNDPRIAGLVTRTLADTPITMVRNDFVNMAKEEGCHLLMMIDSDQSPNKHAGEPWFKPFWDEAFNFIYERYSKGPHLVFAPYCGPPGDDCGENVYVFQWRNHGMRGRETKHDLQPYTREEACVMSGIQEAAAGPTGLILMDMRCCDLIAPQPVSRRHVLEQVQLGTMDIEEAIWAMREGWFSYEWEDCRAHKKASTEDVQFTRDVALVGCELLGYNPVHCAWDSWIGHHKPWNVGKPQRYVTEHVGETLRRAVLTKAHASDRIMDMDCLNQGPDPQSTVLRDAANEAIRRFGSINEGGTPWHEHGHAPLKHRKALSQEVQALQETLGRPLRILEVGTWLGSTALAMANASPESRIFCVDHWCGSNTDETSVCVDQAGGPDVVYNEFLLRIGDRYHKTIFPFRGDSQRMAKMHWEPFDLIFIDADHEYEAVKRDILGWWPHLSEQGLMIGHDYRLTAFPGVDRAINELFENRAVTIGMVPGKGAMWKVCKSDFPDLLGPSKDAKRNGQPEAEPAAV